MRGSASPGGAYDPVAKECRELKEQLRLNDWGYYALVRTLSDGFFGKQSAESVVLPVVPDGRSGLQSAAGTGRRPPLPAVGARRSGLCQTLLQDRRTDLLPAGRYGAGRIVQHLQFQDARRTPAVAGDARAARAGAEIRTARRAEMRRGSAHDDGRGEPEPDGFLYRLSALLLEHLCGDRTDSGGARPALPDPAQRAGGQRRVRRGQPAAALPAPGVSL